MKRCEKNEEKEGEGGRKKKGRGKGGRKKEGGKISFFTGVLYTLYVHSTILKISTPAAGRHLGFFSLRSKKTDLGGRIFFSLRRRESEVRLAMRIDVAHNG